MQDVVVHFFNFDFFGFSRSRTTSQLLLINCSGQFEVADQVADY